MAIITLTTDFGAKDWFVGSMKGVILGINPQASIADITHEVPAGEIRIGAFALAASYWCFPRLTVHCAVIDPGVGGQRAAIVARTADYFFVGPNNGVLSLALNREKVLEVWRVENDALFRKPVSDTFHGRDIFAPVAARLTQGHLLDTLGTKLKDYARVDMIQPTVTGGVLRGEIIYIDHFGNCITNISALAKSATKVRAAGKTECDIRQFYQQGAANQPLALIGSTGFLEIATNTGNAAQMFGLKIGDIVEVK